MSAIGRVVLAVAIGATLAAPGSVRAQTLALVGGTVLDGNGGPPIERGVVVIEGNRIRAVGGPATPIPAGARRLDMTGRYLIPGMMDANVHLVVETSPVALVRYEGRYDELIVEAAQVALRYGLTTVFDSWGPRDDLIKARDAIAAGRTPGARIYLAGNIVGFGGPFSEDFNAAAKPVMPEDFVAQANARWQANVGPELLSMSPAQVREELRRYARSGVDFVKYGATKHGSVELLFSPRVQRVIVEEAHAAGITVQTHTMSAESLELAMDAGVDLFQHCDITIDHPIPAETIARIAATKTPCAVLPHTTKALASYREKAAGMPFLKHFAIDDVNERALLAAGAVLLLSTDAGMFSPSTLQGAYYRSFAPPEEDLLILGEAHFHWMTAMEQKGMRPMDALLAATRNIARAYHVDRDLGTLEPGKIADLVVLEKDPLAAAANYRAIAMVVKDGRVVERGGLPTAKVLR